MDGGDAEVATRRPIGSQLVGHDPGRPYPVPLEELLHQLRSNLRISTSLDDEVQHLALVVDRTPKPVPLASDEHGHLIEMPMIAGLRASLLEVCGDDRTKLQEPAANGLV
jgi:hypothetical protein